MGSKRLRELAARLNAVYQHYERTQQFLLRAVSSVSSYADLSEVEVNQARLAADVLIGIPRALSEISAERLLTGAGPMNAGVPAEAP